MEFIIITITNLIWIFYSMSEGLKEAIFENFKSKSKRYCRFDNKKISNLQRLLVLLSINSILIYVIGWLSIPLIISQIFMFRYFHKIIFKETIHKFNIEDGNKRELILLRFLDKRKSTMVLIGIFVQIFIYFFIM